MDDLKDLLEVLDELRQSKAPHLPQALVEEIIRIQSEWHDDDTEAKRRIGAAVQRILDQEGAAG